MQVVDWISKQAGKIADKFENYKFYVKSTPEHIDSSTRLFLNSYTNRDEEALVPCIYRWSRIKNGILAEAAEFKGNTFLCEPADVGSTIQAQVTSIDDQYPGTAILKFGPVEIDVLLKQTIEGALSTGEAKFQVDIGHQDRTKQCSLQITDDFMRIAHCNSSAHFKFYYCLGEPLINTLSKDPTNISIVFPQKYEGQTIKFLMELWQDMPLSKHERSNQQLTVHLKFINRRYKDEFLFVMKGFIAKKQLKNSSVIKKIEKMDVDNSNIHFMLEIESLRKDLLRLFNLQKKAQEEKKVYMDQTIKLQKQIEDIISSYTKLIEGKFKTRQEFQQSFIDFENKKDHAINNKYRKIEEENTKLKEYIRQKLDGDFKDTYINQLKSQEGRVDYTTINPFAKKKEPFAEIQGRKPNQTQYENLLENLSVEEELIYSETNKMTEVMATNKRLEEKLQKSIVKIEKLEGELDRINRSAVISSNQANISTSRHNMSALDIANSKVVDQKVLLQKKYARLKEDYAKLKSAYQKLKTSNISSEGINPQSPSNEILRLKSALAAMEREKESWKQRAQSLAGELRKQKEDGQKAVAKLQKKIGEMTSELQLTRKNSDVLNRSQHLSMQMDEYNYQQNEILKEQNTFLMNENERLTKMCEKYKSQYKKIKESTKAVSQSLLL